MLNNEQYNMGSNGNTGPEASTRTFSGWDGLINPETSYERNLTPELTGIDPETGQPFPEYTLAEEVWQGAKVAGHNVAANVQGVALGAMDALGQEDSETSRYLERKIKRNQELAKKDSKGLGLVGQGVATVGEMLPEVGLMMIPGAAPARIAGAVAGTGMTYGGLNARAVEEGRERDQGKILAATGASMFTDRLGGRYIPTGQSPISKVVSGAAQGGVSGLGHQVYGNVALGADTFENAWEGFFGGATVGAGINGASAALGIGANDGGKQAQRDVDSINRSKSGAQINAEVRQNHFELNNIKTELDNELFNPDTSDEQFANLLEKEDQLFLNQRNTETALATEKIAQKYKIDFTDASYDVPLRAGLNEDGSERKINLGEDILGVSREKQLRARDENAKARANRFNKRRVQEEGNTTVSHNLKIKEAGDTAIGDFRRTAKMNRETVERHRDRLIQSGRMTSDLEGLYDNLVFEMKEIETRFGQGDIEIGREGVAELMRSTMMKAKQLDLLPEMKSVTDKRFNPLLDLEAYNLLKARLKAEYRSVERGAPDPTKETHARGYGHALTPESALLKEATSWIGGIRAPRKLAARKEETAARRDETIAAFEQAATEAPVQPTVPPSGPLPPRTPTQPTAKADVEVNEALDRADGTAASQASEEALEVSGVAKPEPSISVVTGEPVQVEATATPEPSRLDASRPQTAAQAELREAQAKVDAAQDRLDRAVDNNANGEVIKYLRERVENAQYELTRKANEAMKSPVDAELDEPITRPGTDQLDLESSKKLLAQFDERVDQLEDRLQAYEEGGMPRDSVMTLRAQLYEFYSARNALQKRVKELSPEEATLPTKQIEDVQPQPEPEATIEPEQVEEAVVSEELDIPAEAEQTPPPVTTIPAQTETPKQRAERIAAEDEARQTAEEVDSFTFEEPQPESVSTKKAGVDIPVSTETPKQRMEREAQAKADEQARIDAEAQDQFEFEPEAQTTPEVEPEPEVTVQEKGTVIPTTLETPKQRAEREAAEAAAKVEPEPVIEEEAPKTTVPPKVETPKQKAEREAAIEAEAVKKAEAEAKAEEEVEAEAKAEAEATQEAPEEPEAVKERLPITSNLKKRLEAAEDERRALMAQRKSNPRVMAKVLTARGDIKRHNDLVEDIKLDTGESEDFIEELMERYQFSASDNSKANARAKKRIKAKIKEYRAERGADASSRLEQIAETLRGTAKIRSELKGEERARDIQKANKRVDKWVEKHGYTPEIKEQAMAELGFDEDEVFSPRKVYEKMEEITKRKDASDPSSPLKDKPVDDARTELRELATSLKMDHEDIERIISVNTTGFERMTPVQIRTVAQKLDSESAKKQDELAQTKADKVRVYQYNKAKKIPKDVIDEAMDFYGWDENSKIDADKLISKQNQILRERGKEKASTAKPVARKQLQEVGKDLGLTQRETKALINKHFTGYDNITEKQFNTAYNDIFNQSQDKIKDLATKQADVERIESMNKFMKVDPKVTKEALRQLYVKSIKDVKPETLFKVQDDIIRKQAMGVKPVQNIPVKDIRTNLTKLADSIGIPEKISRGMVREMTEGRTAVSEVGYNRMTKFFFDKRRKLDKEHEAERQALETRRDELAQTYKEHQVAFNKAPRKQAPTVKAAMDRYKAQLDAAEKEINQFIKTKEAEQAKMAEAEAKADARIAKEAEEMNAREEQERATEEARVKRETLASDKKQVYEMFVKHSGLPDTPEADAFWDKYLEAPVDMTQKDKERLIQRAVEEGISAKRTVDNRVKQYQAEVENEVKQMNATELEEVIKRAYAQLGSKLDNTAEQMKQASAQIAVFMKYQNKLRDERAKRDARALAAADQVLQRAELMKQRHPTTPEAWMSTKGYEVLRKAMKTGGDTDEVVTQYIGSLGAKVTELIFGDAKQRGNLRSEGRIREILKAKGENYQTWRVADFKPSKGTIKKASKPKVEPKPKAKPVQPKAKPVTNKSDQMGFDFEKGGEEAGRARLAELVKKSKATNLSSGEWAEWRKLSKQYK